jgi:DNA segregation ATPase FtsK/SpoIIIE-like protein
MATLGLDVHGQPLVLNLANKQKSNVLICGEPGAGKSTFLRTVAASLALQNRQSLVQIGAIELGRHDSKRKDPNDTLSSISSLAHCIFPVIKTVDGGLDVLDFLISEVDYRKKHMIENPLMAVIFDDLDVLLRGAGRSIYRKLIYLLKSGSDAGLRIFLSVTDPISEDVRPLLKFDYPVRIVGRMADADRAWAAAGIPHTGAENLPGKGEFIAVTDDSSYRFQAAYISEKELRRRASQLSQQDRGVLLANTGSNGSPSYETGNQVFSRKNGASHDEGAHKHLNSGMTRQGSWNSGYESGSDDWLTRDWIDRFWAEQG